MKTWQYPDTNGWAEYPFSVDGVNFVSKVNPTGSIFFQIKKVPRPIFESMNTEAVKSMIGNVSEMSMSDLVEKLKDVNENAHEAVIELA